MYGLAPVQGRLSEASAAGRLEVALLDTAPARLAPL